MLTTETKMFSLAHLAELLRVAAKDPPWTFVNLLLYLIAPTAFLKRASYTSMWGAVVAFETINLLDWGFHRKLWEKQKFTMPVFYAFDLLVHWLPLAAFYTAPLCYFGTDVLCKLVAVASNVAWGAWITGGTMDLSTVYVYMPPAKWRVMWGIAIAGTLLAP